MIFYLTTCIIFGCWIFFGMDFFTYHNIAGMILYFLEIVGALFRIFGFDLNWKTKDGSDAKIPI